MSGVTAFGPLSDDPWCGAVSTLTLPGHQITVALQSPEAPQRREPPLLLAPRRYGEVREVERLPLVQPETGAAGLHRPL